MSCIFHVLSGSEIRVLDKFQSTFYNFLYFEACEDLASRHLNALNVYRKTTPSRMLLREVAEFSHDQELGLRTQQALSKEKMPKPFILRLPKSL